MLFVQISIVNAIPHKIRIVLETKCLYLSRTFSLFTIVISQRFFFFLSIKEYTPLCALLVCNVAGRPPLLFIYYVYNLKVVKILKYWIGRLFKYCCSWNVRLHRNIYTIVHYIFIWMGERRMEGTSLRTLIGAIAENFVTTANNFSSGIKTIRYCSWGHNISGVLLATRLMFMIQLEVV